MKFAGQWVKDMRALFRPLDWKMRVSLVVFACLVHVMGSVGIVARQTACAYPPCVDSWAFDALRAVWMVPVFLTPWADFPALEAEFVRDWVFIGHVVLNAVLAVALAWGIWRGVRFAWGWWRARSLAE